MITEKFINNFFTPANMEQTNTLNILYLDAAFNAFADDLSNLVQIATEKNAAVSQKPKKTIDLMVVEYPVLSTMKIEKGIVNYKLFFVGKEYLSFRIPKPKSHGKIPLVLFTNRNASDVQSLELDSAVVDNFTICPAMKKTKPLYKHQKYVALLKNILVHKDPFKGRSNNDFNSPDNCVNFDYFHKLLNAGSGIVPTQPNIYTPGSFMKYAQLADPKLNKGKK